MVSIQTSSIEKKDNLSVYNLNYPIIKSDNEKNIINHINHSNNSNKSSTYNIEDLSEDDLE